MEYNRAWGAYTTFPCECQPPCPRPTDEQLAAAEDRVNATLEERRAERAKTARPTLGFTSIIFPVIKGYDPLPDIEEMFGKGAGPSGR